MLVLSVLCKLPRFKSGFAQSGRLVCALVTLPLTGFVGNEKKGASYLHISGQSKQEHMGRKTVVCEQCGRWKPWLHFAQTAPVSVDLPTTCGSVSPGSRPSHVLTSGQHCSFFPQSRTRSGPLRPGRGRLWLAVALQTTPTGARSTERSHGSIKRYRPRARARSLPIKSTLYFFKLEFSLFKYIWI